MSKLPSLFNIDNELQELINTIQIAEGEITEEQELKLGELIEASAEKVSSYCVVLDRMESEVDFVKDQIKKANEYISKIENSKSRLENIALKIIDKRGEKLEGSGGRWLNTRKSKSVHIENESAINSYYMRMTVSPDKTLIKKDLESGLVVEGCSLKENKSLNWK
jgi:hypothetical protein